MATAPDLEEKPEEVTLFSLHPDPPHGYQKKFTVFLQIRYSIDTTKEMPYVFEYQFERRIPDEAAGFFMQTLERSGWTVIVPGGAIDIPIVDGDTFVVVETVRNGTFSDFYWSTNNEAVMTRESRTSLYGDLKYGDGTTWQELADYKRDHPGESTCRWMSFKARLNPDSGDRDHKFSYFFYLRNPQGNMQDLEVDPEIKNPSS